MEMFYLLWHFPRFFNLYFYTEEDENIGKKNIMQNRKE